MPRSAKDGGRTALVFAPTAVQRGRLEWREPDRAEQERGERLRLTARWARPCGWVAIAAGIVLMAGSSSRPLWSLLLGAVVAVAGFGATFASRTAQQRLMWLNATAGLPVPGDVADSASEIQLQVLYLEEELRYWARQPGAGALRRRHARLMLRYADATTALRQAWLRDDGEWRRAGGSILALEHELDELSHAVTRLVMGYR